MKALELITNSKSRYIIITFIVSAIGFLKSFIILKLFDFDNLGLIALSQTATTTISLLQIGTITGAYRLFSYKRDGVQKIVNSAVWFFFILLTAILLISGIILNLFFNTDVNTGFVILLIIIGVTSLYSNWVVCKLLGTKNISILNKAQLASAVISFIVALLAKWLGLMAVLAGLLLQPLIIVAVAYTSLPKLMPIYNFLSFKKYISKVIALGFVPYLTSALTYFNSQLGRWIITFSLGTALLGKTFLVTLFITLVGVFPGAISNLFFPTIIEKFEMNNRKDLNKTLKRHYGILAAYYVLVILGTIFCAHILIDLFLPRQIESVKLIYAVIPSLFFLHLSTPAVILFNAAKKFRQILIGSLISVFTYVVLLCLYLYFFNPELVGFFVIESISALFFFVYNSYNYFKLNTKYHEQTFG